MEKIFKGRSNLPPFFQDLVNCYPQEQEYIDTEDAENSMIYGTACYIPMVESFFFQMKFQII